MLVLAAGCASAAAAASGAAATAGADMVVDRFMAMLMMLMVTEYGVAENEDDEEEEQDWAEDEGNDAREHSEEDGCAATKICQAWVKQSQCCYVSGGRGGEPLCLRGVPTRAALHRPPNWQEENYIVLFALFM